MARPSTFNQELFDDICDLIADGTSLRAISRMERYPSLGTFLRWIAEDEQLQQQYARAMEIRELVYFEEMIDIADDSSQDTIVTDKGEFENREWVNRSKLKIETRRWNLSRMKPKKYGDLNKIEVTGADGKSIETKLTVVFENMGESEKE